MDVTTNTRIHDDAVTHSGAKTVLNIIALFLVVSGTIFKLMHWKGADILILASTVALLATVYYLYRDMDRTGNDSTTNMMLSGFMFLLPVATLFRRFHWEGANIMAIVIGVFAFIVALYLIFRREELRLPKQFGVVTLLYLLYISSAGFLSARAAEILDANMPQ